MLMCSHSFINKQWRGMKKTLALSNFCLSNIGLPVVFDCSMEEC